jgi:hypothetical protein
MWAGEVGSIVELTKLRVSPEPVAPPGSWNDYPLGELIDTASLPVDYVLRGILLEGPIVGGSVKILRLVRNGIQEVGLYRSTEVVALTEDGFRTRNSIYRMRPITAENLKGES